MSGYELLASISLLGFAYGDFKKVVIDEALQSAFKESTTIEDRSKS